MAVGSHAGDLTVFKNDDFVGTGDRTDALGNDQNRCLRRLDQLAEFSAQLCVGRKVEGGEGIVEDVYLGVSG